MGIVTEEIGEKGVALFIKRLNKIFNKARMEDGTVIFVILPTISKLSSFLS